MINIQPEGAGDASALVRSLGYSFKLAHVPEGWENTMGHGANFIIDQQGRIMFRPHFAGPRDLKAADRLIAGLLQREHLLRSQGPDRTPAVKDGVTGA